MNAQEDKNRKVESFRESSSTLPLLILHGALGCSRQFDALNAALADATNAQPITAHTINFEGHGDRPLGTGSTFGIEQFAENLIAYLDKCGFPSANVFGYSMGGYVALYAAHRFPGRIGRIMTLGTKFAWTPESAAREAAMLNPEKMLEKVPKFVERLRTLHPATDWKIVVEQTCAMMKALGNAPLIDDKMLSGLSNRVRFCLGDRDEMVTLEETVAAYKQTSASELAVLPCTPHPIEKAPIQHLVYHIRDCFGA